MVLQNLDKQMPKLSTKQSEKLYDHYRGDMLFPACSLCSLPIYPGQQWDKSHDKYLPKALGGELVGLAHRRCNRLWNNRHDTPLVAKVKRIRQKHIGAHRSTSRPIAGTHASGIKLHMNSPPTWRDSGRPLWKR